MSTFSATTPDLDGLCRALIGRGVRAAERIGVGRNSRVFRVDLDQVGPDEPASVVVKFYRRDPGDTRDRLATEFGALQFLWRNGLRVIPRPIATHHDRYCAIYEYLVGAVPDTCAVSVEDIDASVQFLADLKALRERPGGADLPVASEAYFSLTALADSLATRITRLRASRYDDSHLLQRWLEQTFEPLACEVLAWAEASAAGAGLSFADELDPAARTVSPSDVGFHNAIRRLDGSLAFVDFEYFGWDDPAKTVVDFVLHPGMSLAEERKRYFANRFLAAFTDVARLADRARIVYPLYGLKWCLILLNDFLPARMAASAMNGVPDHQARVARAIQLDKSDAMARRVRRDYRDNPYLPL